MDGPKTTGIIYYTPHYELRSIDGMTKSAIHVLSCIVASITMRNGQWPFCFASYSVLGASTGYSISSVAKAVSVLKKLGLVIVQKIDGGVNAIYPTENVRKCLSFFPANARLSCTFREHELLYGQRHGRPYRPNAERNERLRREHARAIDEGARLLDTRLDEGAKAKSMGESPVLQGNAVAYIMQTQVVDDDGCGNQEFFVPQRFVQKASEQAGSEVKTAGRHTTTQRAAKDSAKRPARHSGSSQAKKLPWDPTLNVPQECREWLDYSMNREFHSSPVPGMSPQEFGLTYFMWKHPEYIARIQDVIPAVPRPLNAYIVQEYSKSSALFGPRRSRCMSYGEALEFFNYNTGKWNKCWYGFIATFVGRQVNKDCMDNLENAHWGNCEMDCNYTQEASRLYRDVMDNGGDYEDFLDYYRNMPHEKAA